ncbi:MAG: IclR family transcriptional regulator [Myxococcales bacterium]|nr:IclR family transcriptional regulator [Myxococcales bacterium]
MEQSTAIDRALDVLFHLHDQSEALGVSQIGRALSMPKSSAHRMLQALGRRGLVEQDASGRYRTGVGLLWLARRVLDREPLVVLGHDVLEATVAALDETCFLVAARGGRLLVLDKAEGSGLLRASPQVGAEVPSGASAVGKLYRALAPAQLEDRDDPEPFTAATLSGHCLQESVEQARRQGYAVNRQEWIEGLSVVAAPVVVDGALEGAVCAAMTSARLQALGEVEVAERMMAAARDIVMRRKL